VPRKEKKILLFIVEGSNDEVALGMPLENLQKSFSRDDMIMFGITHGDITSDFKVKKAADEIVNCAKKYCEIYKLKKSDIYKIVLLIDMDGAYIPSDAIITSDEHNKAYYGEDADGFRSFFCSPELALSNDYKKSWDAIQQGLNSLHRHSNMNVFFDMHYPMHDV